MPIIGDNSYLARAARKAGGAAPSDFANLISTHVIARGKVRGGPSLKVEGARCPWTPPDRELVFAGLFRPAGAVDGRGYGVCGHHFGGKHRGDFLACERCGAGLTPPLTFALLPAPV